MRSADEVAETLALAYQHRQAIPDLERELQQLTPDIPGPLAMWVSQHALQAVIQHVAGEMVAECPFDRNDPNGLRRGLAELWWERHLRFLEDYREGRPFQ